MYAIYDEVNQGVKLIDDNEYAEVKDKVTSGKPNIDSIDYEKCRDRMRFQPLVIRRFPLRPVSPNDLLAVYDAANQAVIAVTRAEYEKNKLKYEPEVQIPAHAVAVPPPAMTAAFEEPAPAAPAPAAPAPAAPAPAAPAPAAPVAAVPTPPPVEAPQSFAELLFVPPKAGPVTLNPDDLVAVYDKTNQAVIAIPRHVHEKGGDFSAAAVPAEPPAKTTAPVPTTATSAPQKTADLIFQPPKAGKVELSPDDLLAVYDEATQSVIVVTRKQYNQGGDFSAAASPKPPAKIAAPSAPQNTADLIFQPPKAGPVELNPDDLLAVYDEATQSVIVVTRKQYNQGGDFSVSAAAAPAQPPAKTTASSAPQKTADLIYQPPKAGPVELNPDDLLAVYDEATQSVILVTRKQYNQGGSFTGLEEKTPQGFSSLLFVPPKPGPVQFGDDDLLAVYDAEHQTVKTITRKQFNTL